MTSAEARAAFDAALEGELQGDARHAFEQALGRDEALRAEFERHRALFGKPWAHEEVEVDLLAGVQHKLRARSGGRFYRDRFAERGHLRGLNAMVLLSAATVIAVALWFAYQLL
jgi:anti-sigma factor RsiW